MSVLAIDSPLPTYIGLDGVPLSNGYVYFGVEDQDPRTNPVSVFWDEAMTIPAAQPVRTAGGYLYRNGAPSRVWVNGGYSTMVFDSRMRQVLYCARMISADATLRADLASTIGGLLVRWMRTATGAVSRLLSDKLSDHVNVNDFGAVGNGVIDDTVAIQKAINYAKSAGIGCVDFRTGCNYKLTSRVEVIGNFGHQGIKLRGNKCTITNGNHTAFYLKPSGVSSADAAHEHRQNSIVEDFFFNGPGKAFTSAIGIELGQGAGVEIRGCHSRNQYKGLYGYGPLICSFHDLLIYGCAYGIDITRTIPTADPDDYDPQQYPNDLHFHRCRIINNTRALKLQYFGASHALFEGCEIEGNNPGGTVADGVRVIEFLYAGNVTFIGCHIEENSGQYNLYYHGADSVQHLVIMGGVVIPGDSCGNCVYLSNETGVENAANAAFIGTRITNNVGNQVYICEGFTVVEQGYVFGGYQGNLEKLTRLSRGKAGFGGKLPSFATALSTGNSTYGVAHDFNGMVRVVNAAETRLAYLGSNGTTSTYFLSDVGSLSLGLNVGAQVVIGRIADAVEPGTDNTHNLGTAAVRFKELFAGTGTINTSDERSKQQILSVDDAALRAWAKVQYVQYKFNDAVETKSEGARWHFGLIAQRVQEAFASEGLDAFAYGLLCYDEWDDHYEDVIGEDGRATGEQTLKIPAGNRYGIRYEEALALECALQRSRVDELTRQAAALRQ